MNRGKISKMRQGKGITLIALVITIVILIILALVAINYAFGENGLVNYSDKAKLETEIASAKERLEIVLGSAYTEKKTSDKYESEEDFLNNYLNNYISEREPEAKIFNEDGIDYISLNGYIFVLDRSVPELGDYDGTEENRPPAIRDIKETNRTLSELSIEVTTVRAEGATYRYSYKKEGEEYSSPEERSENSYTFSNLESKVKYSIKVELVVDGQVVYTKEEDIILGLLEEGSLKFGEVTWSEGKASITVSTTTSNQIQYKIIPEEGQATEWTNISNNGTISNISNKSTVLARLWDGKNGSEEISRTIADEKLPVIIKFEATEITWNSITVKVNAVDNESGLARINTYKFYLNDEKELREINTKGTYTYTKLNGLTDYKLRVEVYDNVGNKEEKEINVRTKEPSIEDALDISGNKKVYVEIPNKKGGTILCNVLYNDETNGLQIISVNCVDTSVTLSGKDDYNDVISILNAKAEEYNYFGSEYVEARCVGCRPVKDKTLGYESGTGEYGWWGIAMKKADTNHEIDYYKMYALGIATSNDYYWLASRYISNTDYDAYFSVKPVNSRGEVDYATLCNVKIGGSVRNVSYSYGLRPVFILKSGIKVTGGDGTEGSPYTLGV